MGCTYTLLLVSSMYCTGGGASSISTSRWFIRPLPPPPCFFFSIARAFITTPLLFSLGLLFHAFSCSVGGSIYYVLSSSATPTSTTTYYEAVSAYQKGTLRDNTATVLHQSLSLPILLLFSVSVRSRVSCAGVV